MSLRRRRPEDVLQNRVALDRLFREAPCLVSAIFIELDDFEGTEPGARILAVRRASRSPGSSPAGAPARSCCGRCRLPRRRQAERTQPQPLLRVVGAALSQPWSSVSATKARIPCRRVSRSAPIERSAGWPSPTTTAPRGLEFESRRIGAGADPARVQAQLAPLGEPRAERPVQPRFRAGESVAAVVADEHRKSRERQVPMDDGEFNPVVLQLRLLGIACHEPTFAASNSPGRAAWLMNPSPFPAIHALLELTRASDALRLRPRAS